VPLPYQIGLANSDLRKTSDCILAGIKTSVTDPTITTSVKEKEAEKVEEITGTPADAGELYVIRPTAETDSTKAQAFSVLSWSKFKEADLNKALSDCVAYPEAGVKAAGALVQTHHYSLEWETKVRCLLVRLPVLASLVTSPRGLPRLLAWRDGAESGDPPRSAQRNRRARAPSVSPLEIRGRQPIGRILVLAASRAMALNVHVALGSEPFDHGVKRVHSAETTSEKSASSVLLQLQRRP
jgi:hypothetical protein